MTATQLPLLDTIPAFPYGGEPPSNDTDTRCHDCKGPLKDADGTYYSRLEEWGRHAKVVFICRQCKAKGVPGG